jgi:phasin family protein
MEGIQTLFDTDFGKAFASFSGFDTDKLLASQRKTFEAFSRANQLAVDGVQAVARRQAEIAREVIDETSAVLRDIVQPVGPEERVTKNADLLKEGFERGLAHAREINLLLTKAATEAFDVVAKRVVEGLDEIRDAAKTPAAPKKRVGKQSAA